MVTKAGDITGVECELCHQECFRRQEREVVIKVKVKCCPICTRRIDADEEEKNEKKAAALMGKSERRRFFKEQSFKWASDLHGKKVLVFWDEKQHQIFASPSSSYNARGTAYRTRDAEGGWGQIKIIIDPKEHHRISEVPDYHWEGQKKVPHMRPIMDDMEYGLYLNKGENGTYYVIISWGCRKCVVEDVADWN